MRWWPAGRILTALLATIVAAGALLVAQAPGSRATPTAPRAVASALPEVEEIVPAVRVARVQDYWTPARMRAAKPLDLDETGALIPPSAPAARRASRATGVQVPRTAGKLFFSTRSGDAVCSGAAVNTARKNVIITAGHCVHSGPSSCGLLLCSGPEAYTNFLFVPRYSNGSAPDGRWVGTRAWTFSAWSQNGDERYDQALVRLAPRSGRNLVNVVGGNGLAWGYPPREDRVRIWGWPAEAPFDGETARQCSGSTYRFDDTGDAAMACGMNGGASGGPWFNGMLNSHVGFIWAVTSRRTTVGTPYLLARPLTAGIQTLVSWSNQTSRVAARSGTTTRLAARSPGISLSATPRGVGRGQVLRLRAATSPNTRIVLQLRFSRSAPWRSTDVGRTDGSGVKVWSKRMTRTGYRWYRVVTATRRSDPVRVKVYRCPLPLDRRAMDDTGCTGPAT